MLFLVPDLDQQGVVQPLHQVRVFYVTSEVLGRLSVHRRHLVQLVGVVRVVALAPLLCTVAVLVGAVVVVGYDQLPSPPSVRVWRRQRRASGLQQVRGVLG